MDNLKLLRVQVAAKVAYLESNQAHIDASWEGMSSFALHTERTRIFAKVDALREVLRDIDDLESL